MKYCICLPSTEGFLWWNGKQFKAQTKAKYYQKRGWALRVLDRLWSQGQVAMVQEVCDR